MSKPQSTTVSLGVVTVVLTLVGWSSVPLFLRHFADLIDLWTSNGWRYGFSALVWAPTLIVVAWNGLSRGKKGGLPKGLWRAAIVPSIVNAAGQICFTWAHYRIQPGLLTFGLRSQLLFVAIGAWILFPRERAIIRSPGYLIGAAVLVIGIVGVLALGESSEDSAAAAVRSSSTVVSQLDQSSSSRLQGIALAVASGFLFACYGLAVRKYMHGMNPVIAFAAICQYTALALVVLMLLFGERAGLTVIELPGGEILKLLGSALIGIAIGHVFYYFSLARLGVAITAGILQLQPFLVAVGSMALFGEQLTTGQWAAGLLAVVGACLMLSAQWRKGRQIARIEEPVAIAEGESGS